MYKQYLLSKYEYDGAIEEDGAFLLYKILPETSELVIGEIYVEPQKRKDGLATRLANQAMMIAKMKDLKYLTCQTQLTGKADEVSLIAILSYGFKPIKAHDNFIIFAREVV
jgi:GNAT superfamily N-acetyltransferase